MTNTNTTTTTAAAAIATANATANTAAQKTKKAAAPKASTVEAGKKLQAAKAELSSFEKEVAAATDKLRTALAWKVRLSTHFVTLADNTVRKYIAIDSGMPRDVSCILVEGKDHNIAVRYISSDARYEATEKKPLTDAQTAYNNRMDSWAKVCGKEATSRISTVLSDCKGFDELWALVALLERNAEIKASEKFFN